MGMGLGGLGRLGRLGRPAPGKGGGDIIRSIFADGTDGFYFDFSKTDRLFQLLSRSTPPADDAGESIAYALDSHGWGGRSLAALVAAQPEMITNGDFSGGTTGWASSTPYPSTAAVVSGEMQVTATAEFGRQLQYITTVAGRAYKFTGRGRIVSGTNQPYVTVHRGGGEGDDLLGPLFTTNSLVDFEYEFVATGTATTIVLSSRDGTVAGFDGISVKEIPGNHGLRTTASAQPKWQTGGIARFDGADDALVTTLTPATAMTLMFKGKLKDVLGASVFYVMGSRVTAGNDRFYFGFDNSGRLTTTIGGTTLTRTGSLEATVGVGAVVLSGGVGTLYWNAVDGASGAVGTPNTTVPFAIGAINTSGSLSTFFKDDIYHALAIKKALTAAEIAAITNLWGTS